MNERRRRYLTFLLLGFISLYVLIMSRTRFRVNLHSIVAWMLRNSWLKTGAVSRWVFIYELSGCGLKSRCSHSGLFLTILLAQRRITFVLCLFSTKVCLMASCVVCRKLEKKTEKNILINKNECNNKKLELVR